MSTAISNKITAGTLSDIELIGIVRDEDVLSNELNYILQNGFGTNNLSAGNVHNWDGQSGHHVTVPILDTTQPLNPEERQLDHLYNTVSGTGLIAIHNDDQHFSGVKIGILDAAEVGMGELTLSVLRNNYAQIDYAVIDNIASDHYLYANHIILDDELAGNGTISSRRGGAKLGGFNSISASNISSDSHGLFVNTIDVEQALQNLSGTVSTLTTTTITGVHDDLTSLSSQVSANRSNIATLCTDISTNRNNITTNTSHIATISGNLAELSGKVDTNITHIDDLSGRFDGLNARVDQAENNISQNSTDIDSISDVINANFGAFYQNIQDLQNLSGTVTIIRNDLDALSGKVNTNTNVINTNSNNITTVSAHINNTDTWINSITSFYNLSSHYLIDEDHPNEVYELTLKSGSIHVKLTNKAPSDLIPPSSP